MTSKSRRKKTNNLPRILIVVGVIALAAVVLLLKVIGEDQPQTTAVSAVLPAVLIWPGNMVWPAPHH